MPAHFKSEAGTTTWITLGKGLVVTISVGIVLFGLVPAVAMLIGSLLSGNFLQ